MTTLSRAHRARLTLMRATAPPAWAPAVHAFVDKHGPERALQRIRDKTAPRSVADEIHFPRPDLGPDLATIESGRARFVAPADDEWPAQLAHAADDPLDFTPPLGLWVRGNARLKVGASLALIGTERPTDDARDLTLHFAGQHAATGTTIIAPGLFGVALHGLSAAVNAPHRPTPAVILTLACGVKAAAAANPNLIATIVDAGGLIVSGYPADMPVIAAQQYDDATRLATALANATYVVDAEGFAPATGGAATAAALARPVYVRPTRHDSYDTSGSDKLLSCRLAAPAARPEDIPHDAVTGRLTAPYPSAATVRI